MGLSYLFTQQRFLCLLMGIMIPALFFDFPFNHELKLHTHHGHGSTHMSQGHGGLTHMSRTHGHGVGTANHMRVGSRVPLGLKGKMNRILVTGGAGFVGSHLVDRLIKRGDYVIVVDNYFTGRKENLIQHFGNPRFELIRHDVVEPIMLEVDQIYHLACPASPVYYKYNPVKTIISFFFSP